LIARLMQGLVSDSRLVYLKSSVSGQFPVTHTVWGSEDRDSVRHGHEGKTGRAARREASQSADRCRGGGAECLDIRLM